jgi:hypothetical protein
VDAKPVGHDSGGAQGVFQWRDGDITPKRPIAADRARSDMLMMANGGDHLVNLLTIGNLRPAPAIGEERNIGAKLTVATPRRRKTAHRNVGNSPRIDQSPRPPAPRQPRGRHRSTPGARRGGRFYRIELHPAREFVAFTTTSARRATSSV